MGDASTKAFDEAALHGALASMSREQLDALNFGVIGFDAQGVVVRYNMHEARSASFDRDSVLGQQVFAELAPCMNNYLVSGRFDEAGEAGRPLDEVIPYVLTLRMRPTRVKMRLLAQPGQELRFIAIQREAGAGS